MARIGLEVPIFGSPTATDIKARGKGEADTPGNVFRVDRSLKGSNLVRKGFDLPAMPFHKKLAPGFSPDIGCSLSGNARSEA